MKLFLSIVTSLTFVANPLCTVFKENVNHETNEYTMSSSFDDKTFEKENYKGIHMWTECLLNSENDYSNLYYKEYLILNDYLNETEIDEEKVLSFIDSMIKKENFRNLYFFIFSELNEFQKNSLLLIILGSDIDIFNDWYTKSLRLCIESKDLVLANKARDIYNLYSERFEQIICM